MARKFPFSAWVYLPIDELNPEETAVWADCGMTHPMLPETAGLKDIDKVRSFLDAAQEKGIKLIGNFLNLTSWAYGRMGPEEYERQFREVCDVIGDHPALYGFYVCDEPRGRGLMSDVTATYRIQKKVAPHLHPFVNYRPHTYEFSKEDLDGLTFTEWLDLIGNEIGVSFFTLDSYGPMINDQQIPTYLEVLKSTVEASEKVGGPDVWANLLCSAHYAYHTPNEADIRWMLHTAVACGCRGVTWFRMYDRLIGHEYYDSPIDEYGNKTATYYGILRAQRRFNDHYGEIIMSLKRKSTFHVCKDYGVYPMFDDTSHKLIRLKTFEDSLISFFEDEDGREYFCLVTLVKKYHSSYNLFYDEKKCRVTELTMNGKHEKYFPPSDPNAQWSDFNLYPGQMRLFRIDKK